MQSRSEIGFRTITTLCLLAFAAPLAAKDAVKCELLPPSGRMLRAESSNEDLGRLRLACAGPRAAWPDGSRFTLSLRFSSPLHRSSRPRLRLHGSSPGAQGSEGTVSGGVVTWSGIPFRWAPAGARPAVASVTGLAVNAAQSPPEVTVVVEVSSAQAAVTVPAPRVAVARVGPGLRAKVTGAAAVRTCAPDEPHTVNVEISEGFPAAFGANRIMLASDRGTMEGPPTVAAGGLEFRRVDRFTFPRTGRLMYSVQGASNGVLESVSLPLTLTGNDEGDPGQNIQVDLAYVPNERTDRRFVNSATLVVAAYQPCGAQGRH